MLPNFSRVNFVAAFLAILLPSAAISQTSKLQPASASCRLIARDGRDLNPRKLVLTNAVTCKAVVELYETIVELRRSPDFVFEVTGGDRYVNSAGVVLSSTNNEPVAETAPDSQHVKGGAAVDIRIRGVEEGLILQAAQRTAFAGGYITCHYADRHCHLGQPRIKAVA